MSGSDIHLVVFALFCTVNLIILHNIFAPFCYTKLKMGKSFPITCSICFLLL